MAQKKRPAKKKPARKKPARKKPARKKPARRQAAQKKRARKKPARKKPARKKPAGPKRAKAARKAARPGPVDERVSQIQAVIDLMLQNGAVEVEMEEAGSRLRVRLKEDAPAQTIVAQPTAMHHAPAPVAAAVAPPEALTPAAEEAEGEVFTSPMVGTFYRAPSPETEPFVNIGDRVDGESTICIIEAMKVMNEIKAEMEGQITSILVENGEPVEFGQPLFRIKA